MISSLLLSFSLTIIVEFIIVKLFFKEEKVLLDVVLVNLLTNPLLVYIYNILYIYNISYRNIILVIMEIIAFVVEGHVYSYLLNAKKKKTFIVSFVANIVAFILGLVITACFRSFSF